MYVRIFTALLVMLFSCGRIEIDGLPGVVTVEIIEKNRAGSSLKLSTTRPGSGQAGDWGFVSDDASSAEFSNEQDPFATFVGDLFDSYTRKWILSLPEANETASNEITFRITDGYSVKELIDAEIPLQKIAQSGVLLEDLKAAGATA